MHQQISQRHVYCLFACALLLGCDAKSGPAENDALSHFAFVGRVYGMYMSDHGGKPPQNAERFAEYLTSKTQLLEARGFKDRKQFLTSLRDGKELIILFTDEVVADGPGGFPWVAYERTGIEGRRYAIGARGTARELDAAEFADVFGD